MPILQPDEFKNIFDAIFASKSSYRCIDKNKNVQLKLLEEQGIKEDTVDTLGANALHYAAKYSNSEVVKHLIYLGFKWNKKDNNQLTILHYALYNKNDDVIKTLWDMHFELTLTTEQQFQIIGYAQQKYPVACFLKNKFEGIFHYVSSTSDYFQGGYYEYSFSMNLIHQQLNNNDILTLVESYLFPNYIPFNQCRNVLIAPLIKYYQGPHDYKDLSIINKIVSQPIDVYTLENRLNTFLQQAEHGNKPYSNALLQSRINTLKVTLNKKIMLSEEAWTHLQEPIKSLRNQKIAYYFAQLAQKVIAAAVFAGTIAIGFILPVPVGIMILMMLTIAQLMLGLYSIITVPLEHILKKGYINVELQKCNSSFFSKEKKGNDSVDDKIEPNCC